MLPEQTSRTVSERLDTQALRQPSRLRRLRWQLGWAALILVLLVPLTAFLRGDNTIYQSGTLSMSHQFIAHDCSRCHDTPGQTAWRAFNSSASSVSEQACLACHAAPAHHAAKFSARKCGDCHREHAGPGRLSHVVSGFCTECHADLPPGASFARSIKSFQAHPEFAVLRGPDGSIGAKHELLQLAEKDPATGRWRDKAAIALNHKIHLNPNGIPARPGSKGDAVVLEQLDCQSCHLPDSASGNFQPIRFDQHCARCHDEQLAFLGAEGGPLRQVQPLPHREPEIVRGVLRERITRALEVAKPQAAEKLGAEEPLRRFFPGVPERAPLSESQAETLTRHMHEAEGLLFSPRPKDARLGAGCAYCHEVSRDEEQVRITPPAITSRWLPHSRFRHDTHRQLECIACHAGAPVSTATADVLMPSIAVCQKCHQDETSQARRSGSAGSARADCSQCHQYHLHSGDLWDGKHALP